MSRELTNLLPQSQSAQFRRQYFIRVGVVAVLLFAAITIIHAVFLLPTYLYLYQEVNAKTEELHLLSTKSQTSEEQLAQIERGNLRTEAMELLSLQSVPTASALLQAVLAVSHTGISITGFTYTPPDSSGTGTLEIIGTAATREDLRNYDQALSALPFVTSADLPISDYAADTNISFTITVTGPFAKIAHS